MSQTFNKFGNRVIPPSEFENRSWPEDFDHENGNYNCVCCDCGRAFIGHKRRVSCKICSTAGKVGE